MKAEDLGDTSSQCIPMEVDSEESDDEKENEDDVDADAGQRIEDYWRKIFRIKATNGTCKYPSVAKLVKLCLTLSHGNADVERSFSENKLLLTPKRTRMTDATLNGYRSTSSFMKKHKGNPAKLPLTQSLRKAVTSARVNYLERIEQQKKLLQSVHEEQKVTKRDEDMADVQLQLLEAEGLLNEGTKLLTEGCSRVDINKINAANALITRSQEMKKSANEKKLKLMEAGRKRKRVP